MGAEGIKDTQTWKILPLTDVEEGSTETLMSKWEHWLFNRSQRGRQVEVGVWEALAALLPQTPSIAVNKGVLA